MFRRKRAKDGGGRETMFVTETDAALLALLGPQQGSRNAAPTFDQPHVYPPPGFVEVGAFGLGNGDICGYYWPVGQEAGAPLWCETWHDEWALQPVAASLTHFIVTQLRDEDAVHHEEAERLVAHADGLELRWTGPPSPRDLVDDARTAVAEGRLEDAERMLRAAIAVLPEFGEAHIALANLLRRQRNVAEALWHDVLALGSPLCFTRGRDLAIQHLRGARDGALGDRSDDPLFRRRKELSFATGTKRNDDFLLYEEIITELHDVGEHVRAVLLRMVRGELIHAETTSLWERYGWSLEAQADILRDEILTYLPARTPAVPLRPDKR